MTGQEERPGKGPMEGPTEVALAGPSWGAGQGGLDWGLHMPKQSVIG